jgi:hypothetical protein
MTGSTIYLKSVLAGLIAVMIALAAVMGAAIVSVIVMSRRTSDDTAIGWDPISFCPRSSSLDCHGRGVRGGILVEVSPACRALTSFLT